MADTSGASVEERLARIEGQLGADERSLLKKVGLFGGLIALFISIFTGGFQVFDQLVLRQQAAFNADARELAGYVRRIAELNSEIVKLSVGQDTQQIDPVSVQIVKVINAEKASTLSLADRLIERQPATADFANLITLSFEHMNFGNNAQAAVYAKRAEHLSISQFERAESLRYLARAQVLPSGLQNIELARQTFTTALDSARKIQSFLRPQLIASVYADWINGESWYGDCNRARELLSELHDELSTSVAGQNALSVAMGEIHTLTQTNTNCRLN